MSQKINKSKNYTKKYPELKNNIMLLSLKLKEDGKKKENNGNRQEIKIEKSISSSKKNLGKNKESGKLNKNNFSDKLTSGKDKTKKWSLLSNKWKQTPID